MSAKTKIEWVRNPDGSQGQTLNPIRFRNKETGKVGHYCEKISAGCRNCYASRMQKPYLSGLEFIAENRDKGELFFDESILQKVLRTRKPSSFFWADMSDLFGSWVNECWIDLCFVTAALTPQHQHMFLVKRAEAMRHYFGDPQEMFYQWGAVAGDLLGHRADRRIHKFIDQAHSDDWEEFIGWPLPNVTLGVSVEDRSQLHRIDQLRETPAILRFLSLEPLLEDLGELDLRGIGWVIVGGESGPGARPMHPEWARSVRDQCVAVKVPYFHKQNGEWSTDAGPRFQVATDVCGAAMYRVGKRAAGRLLDGVEHNGMPEVGR